MHRERDIDIYTYNNVLLLLPIVMIIMIYTRRNNSFLAGA